MISSDSRQQQNLALLLVAIGLHIASIAAANYVFSHASDKSAVVVMRPLTVQLVQLAPDAVPSPTPKLEAPTAAMNAPPKRPSNTSRVTPKITTVPKPLVPTIKTRQTPRPEASMPEVQHKQKTMPDHVSPVSATAAEFTVATAAPAAAALAKTSVSIPASYAASNRKPDYPKLSQRFGEQGTTVLLVLVQSDGSAGEVQIRKSSGYDLLDASARTAIRNWRFNPATSDGKAIAEWYEISIPFTLQN